MANKREIIINCGISHVSASIFSHDVEAVRLEKVGLQTLNYDYTNDNLWLEAVVDELETLCSICCVLLVDDSNQTSDRRSETHFLK